MPLEEATCLQNLRSQGDSSRLPGLEDQGTNEPHEILRLLNESSECQCRCPHDRIYALLGLAGVRGPGEQSTAFKSPLTLLVDYTIPIQTLYQNFAKSIMLRMGAFAILAADATFGKRGGLDLPS